MPKISIAIPVYVTDLLGVQQLKESFDSIKKQTFTDYEIVVSDNSSNDLVVKLCEKYSVRYKKKFRSYWNVY